MLKIAFLQIAPGDALDENAEIGMRACREAKRLGADIALFPEMWSNGYRIHGRAPQAWTKEAVSTDSRFVQRFAELAELLGLAIGLTYLEACPTGPKNAFALFDRHGQRRLEYAKVHTCDFDAERHLTPGDAFRTTVLDTAAGPVQVGAMICFDREFPESARLLMLQGAELILVPNACPMEINRLSQLRSRAYENMLAIATCNYRDGASGGNGRSTLFDGVAYHSSDPQPRDMCVFEAGESAGIFLAELDLELLRRYRAEEPHGNAFRHPQKYGALVETRIDPPFVRADYRP